MCMYVICVCVCVWHVSDQMEEKSEEFDASRSKGYLCAATSATLKQVIFYMYLCVITCVYDVPSHRCFATICVSSHHLGLTTLLPKQGGVL